MAHTNVSSCVLSIVASFSSGFDVFKQLREKRKRKKRARGCANLDDEEVRLARSLRQGPEDIGREYQKSVQAVGDYFAVGDAIAQTSLAETLLKLNTGLVSIIASFLNRDKKDVHLDYQSLTSLSERSRVDTCRTLRHLFRRMSVMQASHATYSKLALQSREQVERSPDAHDHEKPKRKRKASSTHTKVQGTMLARVVIQDSSKPSHIALVKPGERRKKSSSSNVSRSHSEAPSARSIPLPSPPPPYDLEQQPQYLDRPSTHRVNILPDATRTRAQHSVTNVSTIPIPIKPEALRTSRSTPRLHTAPDQYEPLPPLPQPLPATRSEPRRRKPTPTYYSIASDSTKIGEIPLHKWPVPFDFDAMSVMNKEAEKNGWPANQLGGIEKRKGLLGRLFRRRETA